MFDNTDKIGAQYFVLQISVLFLNINDRQY